MDLEPGRDVAVKVIKKGEKFLVTMARFAHSNHFANEHVERREQSGGAMAVIVSPVCTMNCDQAAPRTHDDEKVAELIKLVVEHKPESAPSTAVADGRPR
jgi:hypothetical protein